jgi:tetratricopeptide (TPR) repeat protein
MLEATVDMEVLRQDVGVETTVFKNPVQSQDTDFDLEDLYLILQMDPNDSLIALKLAEQLRELGRFDEALKILRNVVKIDSRFETLNALAQVEYQLDRLDDSFEHLQQALMIAPEHSPLLFDVFKTLGNIFVRRADFDSAEDSYNKAHRLRPDSDVLYVNIGTLAIQRSGWDEAVDKFRHALQLNMSNDKAWVGLALGHRMKGDFELSWGNLEAALEYNPLNETALGLALDWSTYDGREFRVLELIRNFLVEGGWNERLSLAFAWLSFRRGERAAARLELERLLAVNPANEQALKLINEMRLSP